MIKDWEVKPLGKVGTYREGKVWFDLFDMEIPVNLFEEEVTEEYAERCAKAMNSMSPELVDRICRAAKLYCITFCDEIGEDLSDEMTVPINEDTPASEVIKCIRPVGLCVDTPRDPSKIGYQIEFECDWEIEHGMEVDILDGELVYLSAYNGEGPWDGPYEEDWNYVNGI